MADQCLVPVWSTQSVGHAVVLLAVVPQPDRYAIREN